MRGSSLKTLTYTLVISVLLWSSTIDLCSARRGQHWRRRHNRPISASLINKKGKASNAHSHSYYSHHHIGKNAPKAPTSTHKSSPSPKASPPPQIRSPPAFAAPSHPPSRSPYKASSSTFNVLQFGAKGDGRCDDTKAFEATWAAACGVEASTIIVPSGHQFVVGPVSFSGPNCKPNILFQLDGTVIAPKSSRAWGSDLLWWIEFTKLKGIAIQGTGTIDGSGSVWWQDSPYDTPTDSETRFLVPFNDTVLESPPMPVRSELSEKMPSIKPTALRFYGSTNVTVSGITIQNSPQCHLKFDDCVGVTVHDMNISSPAQSPNTDGIHLQNSRDVNIHHTDVACGDDCVSIQTGSSNVYVHNINCGPGHGISIGSLGRDGTKACVSNITVRDVQMSKTMTGVRIKTWQGGSGSVKNVLFANIVMSEVKLPIVIDQFYCDKSSCKNQTTAVAVSGVTYERIRGTYTVKPVHFACSDHLPCTGVILSGIQLRPLQERFRLYDPFCWQTFGELSTPTVPPISCLQIQKPSKSHLQSELDVC